jgi:hypothetical protein
LVKTKNLPKDVPDLAVLASNRLATGSDIPVVFLAGKRL